MIDFYRIKRMKNLYMRSNFIIIICIFTNLLIYPTLKAHENPERTTAPGASLLEASFSDYCPNGTRYQIHAYQSDIAGAVQNIIEYDSDLGEGALRWPTFEHDLSAHLCLTLMRSTQLSIND
jgi:hypothetical protein